MAVLAGLIRVTWLGEPARRSATDGKAMLGLTFACNESIRERAGDGVGLTTPIWESGGDTTEMSGEGANESDVSLVPAAKGGKEGL